MTHVTHSDLLTHRSIVISKHLQLRQPCSLSALVYMCILRPHSLVVQIEYSVVYVCLSVCVFGQ